MNAFVSATQKNNSVETTSFAYDEMEKLWRLPRTLMGGTKAMRAAGEEYLPREKGQSDESYENRKKRSFLFNAFRRTASSVNAKVFSKPLVLKEDVPAQIKTWSENIDLAGRNLDTLASDVLLDGMQVGLSHVLVDMQAPLRLSDAAGNLRAPTLAEEKAAGRRPYLVHIKPESLIGWRSEQVNGVDVLTQIRFRETITEPDGEFGEKRIDQIRVLWRDRFEVWRANANGKYERFDEGKVDLGKIPLVTFYAERTGFMTAKPPLEDLADLNVAHWQSSSDQRHILNFARVPILFRAGFEKEESGPQEIGPNRMFTTTNAQAKMEVVEHTGAAIESGRQDLIDLEDRMRVMGLELFLPRAGAVTATSRAIDSEEVNSTVKAWALSLKDTLEQAADFMGQWAGLGEDRAGSIQINTDYGVSMRDAQDIQALIEARKNREISREAFLAELKRRGVLVDDYDAEKDLELITAEVPGEAGDEDIVAAAGGRTPGTGATV